MRPEEFFEAEVMMDFDEGCVLPKEYPEISFLNETIFPQNGGCEEDDSNEREIELVGEAVPNGGVTCVEVAIPVCGPTTG